MGVVITIDDLRAYTEVDYIIKHMNQKYIDKVPNKIKEFFSSLKDPNHHVNINPYIPLQNQGLQKYTLEIIALLHLKYWCEDEERKKQLYDIMLKNQEKLELQMKEKYGIEKLFDNKSENVSSNDDEIKNTAENDFSRPRVVQRYSQYQQNNDIQDYTDSVDDSSFNKMTSKETLPIKNNLNDTKGFIQKIISKLHSIFKRV